VAAARRAIRRHDRLAEVVEIMGGTILARDWDVVLAELRVRLDLLDDLLGPGNGYR
jgi:hypothetical protein